MANYYDFKSRVLNNGYDLDGYYGYQCWDGAMLWVKELTGKVYNCTLTGYAVDIWTNRYNSGILDDFDEVYDLQPGDVVVFPETSWTPYTHIAIFDSDAGNGGGYFLGQNQSGIPGEEGGKAFDLMWFPYSATCDTAFRYKGSYDSSGSSSDSADYEETTSSSSDSEWIREDGVFTSKYVINARSDASTDADIVYTFPAGSEIQYDYYAFKNGYVWISQPREDGGWWYLATGEAENGRRTEPAWGTFE